MNSISSNSKNLDDFLLLFRLTLFLCTLFFFTLLNSHFRFYVFIRKQKRCTIQIFNISPDGVVVAVAVSDFLFFLLFHSCFSSSSSSSYIHWILCDWWFASFRVLVIVLRILYDYTKWFWNFYFHLKIAQKQKLGEMCSFDGIDYLYDSNVYFVFCFRFVSIDLWISRFRCANANNF